VRDGHGNPENYESIIKGRLVARAHKACVVSEKSIGSRELRKIFQTLSECP